MSSLEIMGRCSLTRRMLSLVLVDGVIEQVRVIESPAATNLWLSPGLVDLQVNGYGGYDVNESGLGEETVLRLARLLLRQGTTTFLPTIITASEDSILHALETIARARDTDPQFSRACPGIHLEGPHISPEDGARGAHPLEHVRRPDLAEFARWQRAARGLIRLVTLSPHWAGAAEYIAALAGQGVHVAIGHTHASPAQIATAVDAGASLCTHLGNGIAASLPRHPNPLWAQLADDRLRATFIADGHHLPADTLKVMLRAKGIDRSILVSDSVALAGMPPGIYDAPIGGRVELNRGGRLSLAETDLLAGAALPLKENIVWLLGEGLCTLVDAIQMASVNPGKLLGLSPPYAIGSLGNVLQFEMEDRTNTLRIVTAMHGEFVWNEGDS